MAKNGEKFGQKGRFALFILKARAYLWFVEFFWILLK